MGPSEFYSSVANIGGDLFMDPTAVDLAGPMTMPLAAPGSVQQEGRSRILEDHDYRECTAGGTAAAIEGQSSSNSKDD